jgi:hypothetical protein
VKIQVQGTNVDGSSFEVRGAADDGGPTVTGVRVIPGKGVDPFRYISLEFELSPHGFPLNQGKPVTDFNVRGSIDTSRFSNNFTGGSEVRDGQLAPRTITANTDIPIDEHVRRVSELEVWLY